MYRDFAGKCIFYIHFSHFFQIAMCGCKHRYFCPYICLSTWNTSAPTGQIFNKLYIWEFFENLSRKFKFYGNLAGIMCTLHKGNEWQYLAEFFLEWEIFQRYRKNQNPHFMFNNFSFFFSKILRLWYSVLNVVQLDMSQITEYDSCALHAG